MSGGDPPLLRLLPALARLAPRLPLGTFPTPVERVSMELASGATRHVWVKRDDLTAEAYGGNKVRKLEFLLGEARRRDAGRLITGGALGSHHGLATAVYGKRLGLPVTLVLYPQPRTPHVREVLETALDLNAELRLVRRMELLPVGLLRARIRHRRERPFLLVPGGSDRLGTLGYVNAGLELLEQVEQGRAPRPAVIHVACGTMGTAAGLALGLALGRAPIRVHAVRVTPRLAANGVILRAVLKSTARILRKAAGADDLDLEGEALRRITLCHDQFGKGYGHGTASGRSAAEQFAARGISLDPTYTAKAAAGLLAMLETSDEDTHLYWHTLSSRMPNR